MSVKDGNEVRVEKVLNAAPGRVFRALAEGRLFSNCGADGERLEISFRVGGGYRNYFTNAKSVCCGKFLEIVPDRRIVFTWGDEGSDEGFPKTRVSVELSPEAGGERTRVLIVHTGFESQEDAEGHDYGWCLGLEDFGREISEGRIRIVRVYPVHRDALYSLCSDPRKLFAPVAEVERGGAEFQKGGRFRFPTEQGEISGEFQEIEPGRRIVFSWLTDCDGRKLERPSRVTVALDDEEEGSSSIELIHEHLPPGDSVSKHRQGWEYLLSQLQERLRG